jgi:hypothetical protein
MLDIHDGMHSFKEFLFIPLGPRFNVAAPPEPAKPAAAAPVLAPPGDDVMQVVCHVIPIPINIDKIITAVMRIAFRCG